MNERASGCSLSAAEACRDRRNLPQDVARGAVAVMPTVSVGYSFVELFRLLRTDPGAGHNLHERLLPLLNFMMQSVEMLVAIEKLLLKRRGLLASVYCRSPRCTLDALDIAELDHLYLSLSDLLPSSLSTKGRIA